MLDSVSHYKSELLSEIEGLSAEKLREILGFACFVKAKDVIDPSQSHYWTKKRQQMRNGKAEAKQPRPIGLAKEIFQVPPEFFDELPEDLLDEFEGRTG